MLVLFLPLRDRLFTAWWSQYRKGRHQRTLPATEVHTLCRFGPAASSGSPDWHRRRKILQALPNRCMPVFYVVAELTRASHKQTIARQQVSAEMVKLGLEGLENDHDRIWNNMMTGSPGVLGDPTSMQMPWVNVLDKPQAQSSVRVLNARFMEGLEAPWFTSLLER